MRTRAARGAGPPRLGHAVSKTPLAWKNIRHNRLRTAVGMAGVGFAALLIFMQMGFKGAIEKTATQIYDALEFDLMLRSPAYLHLTEPRSFPEARLHQAASLARVERVRPFYLALSVWQAPDHGDERDQSRQSVGGMGRSIITMGVDPTDPPFARPELCAAARTLSSRASVLIDSKSKREYGPKNGWRFTEEDIGVTTALGGQTVEIAGLFELGTGMASNGACMTTVEGFRRACPTQPDGEVTMGLIELGDPRDAAEVKLALQALFAPPATGAPLAGSELEVLTRDEVRAHEQRRWMEDTPFGLIFTFLVAVAIFVGVAIVYQVLSSDIANMMSEYATLKAIGYGNAYLCSVILQQSVLLALVGYLPALAASWVLYQIIGGYAGIPMVMTLQIILSVLGLAVGMCVASGVFALKKLLNADPAELF